MAWILRLEDQRVLRDPAPAVAPPRRRPSRTRRTPAHRRPSPPPPPPPDLIRLLTDDEARIRRRAALAIGRVGLADGVPPLVGAAGRPRSRSAADGGVCARPDRRQDARAIRWSRALADPSPLVQGSAAEALGLIGDAGGRRRDRRAGRRRSSQSGALAQPPGDDDDARRDTPAAAFRLGALRARAAEGVSTQLAAAVLDASGQPRVRWWPVAFALQRLEDKRALPALLTLAKDAASVHARVCGQGARRAEGSRRRCRC